MPLTGAAVGLLFDKREKTGNFVAIGRTSKMEKKEKEDETTAAATTAALICLFQFHRLHNGVPNHHATLLPVQWKSGKLEATRVEWLYIHDGYWNKPSSQFPFPKTATARKPQPADRPRDLSLSNSHSHKHVHIFPSLLYIRGNDQSWNRKVFSSRLSLYGHPKLPPPGSILEHFRILQNASAHT